MRRPGRISSALQWRSISRARVSRSPGERAASGPTSFIAGPGHISSHREELRHLPHTPSSSASRPRAGRRRALGLDRGGDCHVYGTSIWRSSVSRADEIGGRRRLSLAIVVRLYEPAGKAASRGQRPGLRLRPAAEEPAPGADADGDRRNGHVVDHILIEPLPYRDPTVEVHAPTAGGEGGGGRRNGPVVDPLLIEPLPYRDPTVEVHATNAVSTSEYASTS